MFAEDAYTHIMPFSRLSERKGRRFDAVLDGADAAIGLRVIQGLGENSSRHHDTLEATCDAVRGIAKRLLWNVNAAYEIPVITNEQRDDNEFMRDDDGVIRVRSFTTARLFHLPGLFVQIPPLKDREYFGRWIFAARSRHVWRVSMPRSLGGSSGYRRLRRRLSRFTLTSPMWAPEAMSKESEIVRYDFLGHRRLLEQYVARAVRPWGWNRRDWSDDHQTQFFNFYRMITFQWALAVFRDHIIKEVNLLLQRMDVMARLSLKGFLTPMKSSQSASRCVEASSPMQTRTPQWGTGLTTREDPAAG